MQARTQDWVEAGLAANDLIFSERYLATGKRVTGPPTSSASPASISRGRIARSTRSCPPAAQTKPVSRLKHPGKTGAEIRAPPTACAAVSKGTASVRPSPSRLPGRGVLPKRWRINGGHPVDRQNATEAPLDASAKPSQGNRSSAASSIATGGNNSFGVNAGGPQHRLHTGPGLGGRRAVAPDLPCPGVGTRAPVQ